MSPEAYPKKHAFESSTDTQAFKTVQIYEDFTAGVRARWLGERLARAANRTLEVRMWNFNVLTIREIRIAAASAARSADVVILSQSGQLPLPPSTREWLNMWLSQIEKEKPALVALFDSLALPGVSRIRAYLSLKARRCGIDFFPLGVTASMRQEPLATVKTFKVVSDAVRRTKRPPGRVQGTRENTTY